MIVLKQYNKKFTIYFINCYVNYSSNFISTLVGYPIIIIGIIIENCFNFNHIDFNIGFIS